MDTKKEVKWIDGRLWAEDCLAMELMGFADEFFKTENSADAVSFLQEWISELSDEVLEAHLKRLNPLILRCTREQRDPLDWKSCSMALRLSTGDSQPNWGVVRIRK